jgi:hypothetical protein
MDHFVEQLVAAVVWVVGLVVYLDLRRRGRHGFTRLVAFWTGMPATFISMFVVKEGSQPDIAIPADDELGLLEEIRRDRDEHPGLQAGGNAPAEEEDDHHATQEET